MPIVDVELVGAVPAEVGSGLAQRLADRVGDVLGSRPQGTWIRLRFLAEQNYAENLDGPPPERIEPVFVSILQAELPPEQQLAELAGRLATAIGAACSRPVANVHVLFEAAAVGRLAFGGKLLT